MKLNKFKIVILLGLINCAFAVNQNASAPSVQASSSNKSVINQNVKDLSTQINQINSSISATNQQKAQVDKAITASHAAIVKAQQTIKALQNSRNFKEVKLSELQGQIPVLTDSVQNAKKASDRNMAQIYQQMNALKADSNNSILSGSSALEVERQKIYMSSMLKLQLDKYKKLNSQLDSLQKLSVQLQNEITRIDAEMKKNETLEKQYTGSILDAKTKSAQLNTKLASDQKSLSNLKEQQAQLNKLLAQIAVQEEQARKARLAKQQQQAAATKTKPSKTQSSSANSNDSGNNNPDSATKKINYAGIDNTYEDNSPFMSRNLVKPIDGKVLVGFGEKRDGVRNNGVLVSTSNNATVKSVSSGNVMFSGVLPGFGQIIVIDNGDNYTSVYSGVVPKVNKGDNVKAGDAIASTGNSSNQPMGGVYFELRRLGQAVNPMSVFK